MKKTVRILALVGAVIACLIGMHGKRADAKDAVMDDIYLLAEDDNTSDEYKKNEFLAGLANTNFYNFYLEKQSKSGKVFREHTVNGLSMEYIPDYFGGTYVNIYGNLVFEVTEKYRVSNFYESTVYKEIMTATEADSETIVIRFVPVAFKDLLGGMIRLGEYAKKEKIDMGFGIDDYQNSIEIDISRENSKKVPFAEILEGLPYIINDVPFGLVKQLGLYPGEGTRIGSRDEGTYFSVAFPAKLYEGGTYKYGFLTAAHPFGNLSSATVYIYTGGNSLDPFTSIGTYSSNHSVLSGNTDAAFVECLPDVDTYRTVFGGVTTLYSSVYLPARGSTVYKKGGLGGSSGGITSGVIKNLTYSYLLDGVLLEDFVKAGYDSVGGDSGGLVYTDPGQSGCSYVCGIHEGRTWGPIEAFSDAVFVKAQNALDSLGATMY